MAIEGATYVVAAVDARDPARADLQCNGTDDQVEIQQALDGLPTNGGKVILTEGTFNISGTIRIEKDSTTFEGNGTGQRTGLTQTGVGTKLKAATGLTGQIIRVQRQSPDTRPVYGVILRDFLVDGNEGLGTGIDGILFRSNRGCIENVHVHKTSKNGIVLLGYDSTSPFNTYDTRLISVVVGDCKEVGMLFDSNSDDCHLLGAVIFGNGDDGIQIKAASQQVTACHIYGNDRHNIFFNGSGSRTKIVGCKIEGAGRHGINIDSTNGGYSDIQIVGCNLKNSSRNGDNTYDHIILQGPSGNGITRVQIVGNAFTWIDIPPGPTPKPRYGVNLDSSSSQHTLVEGNVFGPMSPTPQFGTAPLRNNGNTSLKPIV